MNHTDRAIHNDLPVFQVDRVLIDQVTEFARASSTGRYRLCLHRSPDDLVQEMLVVHCYDNYSRPHRHPTHIASTRVVLVGAVAIYLFDDDAQIQETIELEAFGGQPPFALRIEGGRWYMPVCRSRVALWFEVMAGPFRRDEVNEWAPWSPAEDDQEGIATFLARLCKA